MRAALAYTRTKEVRMDPDVSLERALEVAQAILDDKGPDENVNEDAWAEHARACEIAEYVVALDEWLTKGGFLPATWAKPAFSNGVTLAQAIALGSRVKPDDQMHVTPGGAGLSNEYLLVTYTNDSFTLGIDREGRCSS